jgi:hypothetical protein
MKKAMARVKAMASYTAVAAIALPLITQPGPSLMARHALPGCSFFALGNQGTKFNKVTI